MDVSLSRPLIVLVCSSHIIACLPMQLQKYFVDSKTEIKVYLGEGGNGERVQVYAWLQEVRLKNKLINSNPSTWFQMLILQ